MEKRDFTSLNLDKLETPCFVINTDLIEKNGQILKDVQEKSGCKILHALKAFSHPKLIQYLKPYVEGICASGLWEAQLGEKYFNKEVHTYGPAYTEKDLEELIKISNKVVFNTPAQIKRFLPLIKKSKIDFGLRINPEHSETDTPMYDPVKPNSRLGTTSANFDESILPYISGLHFHTLCEKGAVHLQRTLAAFEDKFKQYFPHIKWVNFGGGHLITHPDYDRDLLIQIIKDFKSKYNLQVYLEPGEASVIGTGLLITSVLDVLSNGADLAIVDTSASAHMPDTLEMPYRPDIWDSGKSGEKKHNYILGGMTCLAGDEIGEYSFDEPLEIGQKLIFEEMSHYTLVKTTMFNGVKHPSIYSHSEKNKTTKLIRKFEFTDFVNRIS